jgi:hypothetical protein
VDGASGLAVPCFGRTLEIWTLNIYRPYKDRARKCTNTTSTQTHTQEHTCHHLHYSVQTNLPI